MTGVGPAVHANRRTRRRHERGQSTVELAMCTPVIALSLLLVAQVMLLARDQLLVVHAAREAARAAAIDNDSAARPAARAAADLDPDGLVVRVARARGRVTATVVYTRPARIPIIGSVLGAVHLSSRATMAAER